MSLNEYQIELFWKKRVDEILKGQMYYDNKTPIKTDFIKSLLPIETLLTEQVLHYGCGIHGDYNELFKHYMGVDINDHVINYCSKHYKNKYFNKITLYQTLYDITIDTFFSSECLQHNDDESIDLIVESLSGNIKTFYIYETSSIELNMTKKRSTQDYFNLFSKQFKLDIVDSKTHIVSGDEFTMSIFKRNDN